CRRAAPASAHARSRPGVAGPGRNAGRLRPPLVRARGKPMGQGRGANDDRGRAAAGRPPSALSASAPSDPAGVAAALVERLAAFLKASFLYPPGNQRVRLLADALLTALRAQLDAQPVVELA